MDAMVLSACWLYWFVFFSELMAVCYFLIGQTSGQTVKTLDGESENVTGI